MKRKSFILGTCMCLMLSLAACSKNNKKDGTEDNGVVTGGAVDVVTGGAADVATGGSVDVATGGATDANNVDLLDSNVVVTLGQYKGLEIKLLSAEVTDEEINQQVDAFNQECGKKVKVTDRDIVQKGDIVNIDYLGKIDGVAFEGGTATGSALTIGSGQFIEGFEEGLVGKKVGETLDVTTKFPVNYGSTDLAGKEAIFTVTINYIEKLEPISDEVVAANDPYGNKTVADFKANIKKLLQDRNDSQAQKQKELDLLSKAIENTTFANIQQSEYDNMQNVMKEYYNNLAIQSGTDLESYLLTNVGMTMVEFEEEAVKQAETYINQKYLLDKIVKEEKLEISDKEYDEKVAEYMTQFSMTDPEQFVQENGGKEFMIKYMLSEKAKNLIVDTAVEIK